MSKPQTPDDLLAEALRGKSDDFKRRVLDFVSKTGLSQDDPLFLVLVATGQLEVMLSDAPQTLQLLFQTWNQDLAHNLEQVEQVAIARQKVAINRAAQELIHESLLREGRNIINSVFPATVVFFFIFAIGFIAGVSIPPWLNGFLSGGYTQVEANTLTWDELSAMKWAASSEGKFARDLMNWNRGYLENRECIKDVQRLGVVLSQYNRKAKSGFCLVWVTPPDKRK
ncbi:DUF6753 family protein [Calothrix sp. 336/3]|uniref:DUF6753 family protein n=1 Tax=Calothrix sp. 336/3 TaxID=1337936 RepID=UPI0004E335FF|nr:DUF6753 family protein [Calothrix sp. 336/3]AKG21327.1 hypothetical protein IJ00_08460 [Calothrix sp. 336/3]